MERRGVREGGLEPDWKSILGYLQTPLSRSPPEKSDASRLRFETPAGPVSLAPAVVHARVGEKLGLQAALRGCFANFFP